MNTFDFFFYLELLTRLFCHIDSVNTALQKKTLCFQGAVSMILTLKLTLQEKNLLTFDTFWGSVEEKANEYEIPEPTLPR